MKKILPNKVNFVVYQPKAVVPSTVEKFYLEVLEEQKDNMKGICWQRWVTFFAMYIITSLSFHLVVYKVYY